MEKIAMNLYFAETIMNTSLIVESKSATSYGITTLMIRISDSTFAHFFQKFSVASYIAPLAKP